MGLDDKDAAHLLKLCSETLLLLHSLDWPQIQSAVKDGPEPPILLPPLKC